MEIIWLLLFLLSLLNSSVKGVDFASVEDVDAFVCACNAMKPGITGTGSVMINNEEYHYDIVDNFYWIYSCCIAIGNERDGLINFGEDNGNARRLGVAQDAYRWLTNSVGQTQIPYVIDDDDTSGFDQETIALIEAAIDDMNQNAFYSTDRIKFVSLNSTDRIKLVSLNSDHHIRIVNKTGCWSYIGNVGYISGNSPQELSIGTGCEYKGIIQHELLHALGIYHEHTRPDRNEYVQIKWENILENRESNFKINDYVYFDPRVPYDFRSIMHYSGRAFSKDRASLATIESVTQDVPTAALGQRGGLTLHDILFINIQYHLCDGEDIKNGSFECACNAGYEWSNIALKCVEPDAEGCAVECADPNAFCIDEAGSYECKCDDGYKEYGVTCVHINECTVQTDKCQCTGYWDISYECYCNDGYVGDGNVCQDVNECIAETDNCDINAECINTEGSYQCVCKSGYEGDGNVCQDVNECEAGTDNCDSNALCINTDGGFICQCNTGYTGDGVSCTDIDECSENTHNCDPNASCINTEGSFDCVCIKGFVGDGYQCIDILVKLDELDASISSLSEQITANDDDNEELRELLLNINTEIELIKDSMTSNINNINDKIRNINSSITAINDRIDSLPGAKRANRRRRAKRGTAVLTAKKPLILNDNIDYRTESKPTFSKILTKYKISLLLASLCIISCTILYCLFKTICGKQQKYDVVATYSSGTEDEENQKLNQ